jgi:hypothetical protein
MQNVKKENKSVKKVKNCNAIDEIIKEDKKEKGIKKENIK